MLITAHQNETRRKTYLRKIIFVSLLLLTMAGGIWSAWFVGRLVDEYKRDELLRLCRVGAAGINADRVLSFTGTPSDRQKPDWLAVRNRLAAILRTDTLFRWAYLMYARDTAIYFFMDMPDSLGDNAVPGEHYKNAPEPLFEVFRTKKPTVVGPYTDKWGTFISAFHPIIHPVTGQLVAVFGLDISAFNWSVTIRRQQIAPLLVTLMLVILEIIGYVYIRKRRKHLNELQSAYMDLERRIEERTADLLSTNFELELQIQERKKTEDTLRQTTEELDRFFTVNLDLLCIADTQGVFRRLNAEWERTLGYPLHELQGKKIIELVHPDDVKDTLAKLTDLSRDQQVINFVNRFRCKEGSYRWIEWRSYPSGDMIYAAARDITAHVETLNALRQSEQKFRLLAEETNEWIWELNQESLFVYSNPKVEEITGYTLDEVIGHSPFEWMSPEDAVYFRQLFSEDLKNKKPPAVLEVRMRHKDGRLLYLEISYRLVLDEHGNIQGLRGIARDVTEKKMAESELRQTKERLEYILGVTQTGIDIVDEQYNLRYVDPAWQKRYGNYNGKKCYVYFRNRKEPCPDCNLPEVFAKKTPVVCEAVLPHENNRVVEVHSIPFKSPDGEWLAAEFNIDITDHKRIEQALRDSENRYRAVLEQATEGIFLFDVATRKILEANRSYQTMLGYTTEELTNLTIYDVIAHDAADIDRYIERILQQERLYIGPRKHRHKLGYTVDVEASAYRIDTGSQSVICVVLRDIRERIQAERMLHRLVRRQSLILQSLPLVFYTASPEGDMPTLWISDQVEKITGYPPEAYTGNSLFWTEHLHPKDRDWIVIKYRSILQEKALTLEYQWLCADGQYRWFMDQLMLVEGSGNEPAEIIGFWMDITERKKNEEERRNLEAQLQHAQKLESIGILAGGIAHDFNNLLTSILGYADLSSQKIQTDIVIRDYLGEIQNAALQASDLCRQLLAYSGKGKYIVQTTRLPKLIEEMAGIIKVSLSKKILLQMFFDPDTPPIEADQAQIRQVILNLVINAAEAIGQQAGVITIRTGKQWCGKKFFETTWLADPLPEGDYALLEVTDTGCGMDEATLPKIFDPFFTTKFSGRGLGLAAVLGIVRGHKAALQVFSSPGKGTQFRIFFPSVDISGEMAKPLPVSRLKQYHGMVLLADDEESILRLGKEILEMNGFQVELARDGAEAVERFRQNPQQYQCVILDLTMPRMNGKEALSELRKIYPEAVIIISSGYAELEIARQFADQTVNGFIQKPYNIDEFIRIIDKVLHPPS